MNVSSPASQSDQVAPSGKASASSSVVDLDAPVYRIFPVWAFDEVLILRRLRLVQPSAWEDPLERLMGGIFVPGPSGYVSIEPKSKLLYAQCWSSARESDTLWRAYSRVTKHPHHQRNIHPGEEGVQVRSTARKLLDALRNAFDEKHDAFVGQVNYMSEARIQSVVGERLLADGVDAYSQPNALADFYSMKRDAFSSEAEVRLMLVVDNQNGAPPAVELPIDPNNLFDEVSFDPRLAGFERAEREAALIRHGYVNPCPQSGLYKPLMLELQLKTKPD